MVVTTCNPGMGCYLSRGLPAPMRRQEDYFPRFKLHPFPALPPAQARRRAVKQSDPLHRAPWVVHGALASLIPAPDTRMVVAVCDPGMGRYLSRGLPAPMWWLEDSLVFFLHLLGVSCFALFGAWASPFHTGSGR